jgi:hypothetical protein
VFKSTLGQAITHSATPRPTHTRSLSNSLTPLSTRPPSSILLSTALQPRPTSPAAHWSHHFHQPALVCLIGAYPPSRSSNWFICVLLPHQSWSSLAVLPLGMCGICFCCALCSLDLLIFGGCSFYSVSVCDAINFLGVVSIWGNPAGLDL